MTGPKNRFPRPEQESEGNSGLRRASGPWEESVEAVAWTRSRLGIGRSWFRGRVLALRACLVDSSTHSTLPPLKLLRPLFLGVPKTKLTKNVCLSCHRLADEVGRILAGQGEHETLVNGLSLESACFYNVASASDRPSSKVSVFHRAGYAHI